MNSKRTRVTATLGVMTAVIIVANLLDKTYSYGLSLGISGAALAVCALVSVTTFSFIYNKFPYAIAAGAIFGLTSFVLSFIFQSVLFQNPLVSVLPRLFICIIGFGAYKLAGFAARGLSAAARITRFPFTLSVIISVLGVEGIVVYIILLFNTMDSFVFFILLWICVLAELFLVGFAVACGARIFGKGTERGAEQFALSVGSFFTVVSNTALVLPMMFLFSDKYGSLSEVYATLMLINFLPELLITTVISPFVILGVRKGLRLGVDGKPRKKQEITEGEVNS